MLTIYSIGHSNLPESKFVELLRSHSVQLVIDVRSSPYSRHAPHFNRETLEITLRREGINYRYAGDELGGRPKDPSCYKNGEVPSGKADYLNLVDYRAIMKKEWFRKALSELVRHAENARVCIMCSEEDPSRCHRHHLIGKALVNRDIQLVHIRKDGKLVKDQHLPDLPNDKQASQLRLF